MVISYFIFVLLTHTPTISNVDSLHNPAIIKITMDSLEVSPMPTLSILAHGNTPVDISFEKSEINLTTRFISIKGQVFDHQDKLEIPGIRIVIGSIDSSSEGFTNFTPRASVMTDYRGEFSLNTILKKSDVLVIVWLGHLEKMYSFRKMIEQYYE